MMESLFKGGEATVLVNPALSKERIGCIETLLHQKTFQKPHLWIASSGSFAKEGVSKWVALSKEALQASAEAVNRHLQATHKDVWLNPLPLFHVGGLAIVVRASLTNSKVVDFKPEGGRWSPETYYQTLQESEATLTSLVPTQLYDLVLKGLPAPKSVRAAVIGGGALEESLYMRARSLGWTVLPSYGMTESASQVATAPLSSLGLCEYPRLQILSHLRVSLSQDNLFVIEGKSLLSTYGMIEGDSVHFFDPKTEGALVTSDRGEIDQGQLKILGRADDVLKIVGENVDIAALQRLLDKLKLSLEVNGDCYVIAKKDARRGSKLVLLLSEASAKGDVDSLLKEYNRSVFPFERIDERVVLPTLPKTPLGKLERKKLSL